MGDLASIFGRVVILVGAVLELRHLATSVLGIFSDCRTFGCAFSRLIRLDDVSLAGLALCLALAVAILFILLRQLSGSVGTQHKEHEK